MSEEISESMIMKLLNYIIENAIDGVPPLTSARNLALEYKIDTGYENDDERVDSLINWETSKNFTSGFITGLGGIITLPVAIPSAFGASWVIQARMAGAIAQIYGHDLREDRVKTLILLSLVGDAGKEILKNAGVKVTKNLAKNILKGVSGKTLIDINKKIGFRLITKAGETGTIILARGIPFVGGVVAGSFDAISCRIVGRAAKGIFGKK